MTPAELEMIEFLVAMLAATAWTMVLVMYLLQNAPPPRRRPRRQRWRWWR